MTTVKQLMLRELKARKLMNVDVFAPFYISSIGAHIFNINNLSREEEKEPRKAILYHHGKPFNTRIHIMFVAPPGFGKSLMIEHFLRDQQALLAGSCVDTQWEGFMTEAGFVGTIREMDGQKITKPGVAMRHKNSIIGMEEFAILSGIMATGTYGGALTDQLLTSLDSGYVGKSLGPGDLKYRTNCTIWPGTQVQRFELGAGLPRRFIFMLWFPNRSDQESLKDAWWDGFNVHWRPGMVQNIANGLARTNKEIDKLETDSVTYHPDVKDFIRATGAPHYEFPLFVRLLLGDMIMNGEFNQHLELNLFSGRQELIQREVKWREMIRYDAQMAQVRAIIRHNENDMTRNQLLTEMTYLGIDRIEGIKTIEQMIKLKILERNKGNITIPVDESWSGK